MSPATVIASSIIICYNVPNFLVIYSLGCKKQKYFFLYKCLFLLCLWTWQLYMTVRLHQLGHSIEICHAQEHNKGTLGSVVSGRFPILEHVLNILTLFTPSHSFQDNALKWSGVLFFYLYPQYTIPILHNCTVSLLLIMHHYSIPMNWVKTNLWHTWYVIWDDCFSTAIGISTDLSCIWHWTFMLCIHRQ